MQSYDNVPMWNIPAKSERLNQTGVTPDASLRGIVPQREQVVINYQTTCHTRIVAVGVTGCATRTISRRDLESGYYVLEDVVRHGRIFHHRDIATLASANGKQEGCADLSSRPHVLYSIAVKQHTPSTF